MKFRISASLCILLTLFFTDIISAQGKLTFEDVMKFEDINSPVISSKEIGSLMVFGLTGVMGKL